MNKLIILAIVVVLGLLSGTVSMTLIANAQVAYNETKRKQGLIDLDRTLDNLVNSCSTYTNKLFINICIASINKAWNDFCPPLYNELDTCKNGKIENYLIANGMPQQ
jgi:hypothetical protein